MKKNKNRIQGRHLFLFLFIILFVYLAVITFRTVTTSSIFKKKAHINVVVYGQDTHFYSLSKKTSTNYYMYLWPDIPLYVPGGLGRYRLGALGKLVSLEKNNDLYRNSFSYLTGSFIDYYVYPSGGSIYYGASGKDSLSLVNVAELMFNESNMNILEKIYVSYLFLKKSPSTFKVLKFSDNVKKSYQGYFYNEAYRNEKLNVQILYTKSYTTSVAISQIIEGEGIRIVDISSDPQKRHRCELVDGTEGNSQTVASLSVFFHCPVIKGKTGGYDILFKLGELEESWLVKESI